jgi:hypothetical protein
MQKDCERLERCVWTECPPNADCQLPAWCAVREPAGPNCGPGGDPYALQRGSEEVGRAEVAIGAAYRPCDEDADCMLVFTGCDGCCQQDAIAKSLEGTYQENFRAACTGYAGGICDCEYLPADARCVERSCTRVLTAR